MAGQLGIIKKEVYSVLLSQCERRFFLRRHESDSELLISDFPRAAAPPELACAIAKLSALDYLCTVDERAMVLSISPQPSCLFRLLGNPPPSLPPLPSSERLWPVYSLCSLMALHPAKLFEQPLLPLFAMLKAMDTSLDAAMQLISPLTCFCAELLRQHAALPTAIAPMLRELMES